jgi:ornithine carbamoyltransferase
MRHFINTQDWSIDELQSLLAEAARLKRDPIQPRLQAGLSRSCSSTLRCARERRSRSAPHSSE